MRIKHNIPSLNTNNRLQQNKGKIDKTLEKLSSGYSINRAGDDAAGLAISEKMRGQIRGLDMASKNIQDGVSLIQTAEGALNEIHSLLQRGRELSVQAANDTNVGDDRNAIQSELEQIKKEITSIGNNTEFNTKKLLDGSIAYKQNPSTPITPSVDSGTGNAGNSVKATVQATGAGVNAFTVADGWIAFGQDADHPHKVKLNEGETVIDDPANRLYTKFSISVYYAADGTPQRMNISSIPDGYTILSNSQDLTYSYNGMTVDVSKKILVGGGIGEQHQGNIFLTAGSNDVDSPKDEDVQNGIDDRIKLQIGANAGQSMALEISDVRSQAIGISEASVLNNTLAQLSISQFDNAINTVSSVRSNLGTYQNRLKHAYNTVTNTSENLQSAESRIRDTDMAKEMMEYTKDNILMQAAQAMLSQSNQQPQGVLQLLQ